VVDLTKIKIRIFTAADQMSERNVKERALCVKAFQSVRFEVFTAVTMKNVVLWDIKPQFVLHRRHILLRYKAQPEN
jgi:hypothetical protein